MVKKSTVIEKRFGWIKSKQVTIYPDKDNQVFTYKQIVEYTKKQTKDLPKGSKVIVRGLNILRDTTLKSFNSDFMNEDEYNEYAKGKVKDDTKFQYFHNFTITVKQPNEQNMFVGHKKGKK